MWEEGWVHFITTRAGSVLQGFSKLLEPAIRIERTPCGLRLPSDNLTPQETTN
jgi:hypothetical protein